MKTIAVISQKGGVGKTTLATLIAVEATRAGLSSAVFDLDPQASAAFWRDLREAEDPAVVSVPASRLGHALETAARAGLGLAVIDTPPHARDAAFEAAQRADLILVPSRPAILDGMAMTKTLELLSQVAKPAAVVLTFCPPVGREIGDTEAAVAQLGVALCPVRIHGRIAYARAQQTGLVATEFDPQGKAAAEAAALYRYSLERLSGAAA